MKIFITGATGYLGNVIVNHAIQAGHQVRAFCRKTSDTSSLPDSAEIVEGDLDNDNALITGMRGCDAVIHSAALVSIWRRDPADFFRVNVNGTQNILHAVDVCKIPRVIYTSSFFALGPTDDKPADENWLNLDVNIPTEYARSKVAANLLMRDWVKKGRNAITVHPGLIYGPGKATQGNHITQLIQDHIAKKLPGIPGNGAMRCSYSYVDDVAKGHILALEKGKDRESYILGGEDASFIEFLDIVESVTKIPRTKRKIPIMLVKFIGLIEEFRARMSSNYIPKVTWEVAEVYEHHWRFSSQKAIAELGYIRTPLKIGVIKTLEELGFAIPEEKSTAL